MLGESWNIGAIRGVYRGPVGVVGIFQPRHDSGLGFRVAPNPKLQTLRV